MGNIQQYEVKIKKSEFETVILKIPSEINGVGASALSKLFKQHSSMEMDIPLKSENRTRGIDQRLRWSEADKTKLISLGIQEQFLSWNEIAEKLNRTPEQAKSYWQLLKQNGTITSKHAKKRREMMNNRRNTK